jgi:hypothetical protein
VWLLFAGVFVLCSPFLIFGAVEQGDRALAELAATAKRPLGQSGMSKLPGGRGVPTVVSTPDD